jgi:hypothetical protein
MDSSRDFHDGDSWASNATHSSHPSRPPRGGWLERGRAPRGQRIGSVGISNRGSWRSRHAARTWLNLTASLQEETACSADLSRRRSRHHISGV